MNQLFHVLLSCKQPHRRLQVHVLRTPPNHDADSQIPLILLLSTLAHHRQATKLYLDALLPPVLHCLDDAESRVRYYACESLYNIAKVRMYTLGVVVYTVCNRRAFVTGPVVVVGPFDPPVLIIWWFNFRVRTCLLANRSV